MSNRFSSAAAVALSAVALLALGGLASARDATLSPEQFIKARQASYDMSVMTNGSMRDAMKAGREAKTQAYPAEVLGKWARVLPTLFPKGTGQGETKIQTQALPTIWSDRPGFEQAAANYAAAADKLAELAKANDTEGFKVQLVELGHACDACHARFKAGDQGPK
jgi:cytochrome c556